MVFKIALSEGHGKNTAGKRSPAGEREWGFNNKVGLGFREEIAKYENVAIKLVSDPTGNRDVPLAERTNIANDWGADIYVSIHHNANTGKWGTWTGTETYTYNGSVNQKSVALAKASHEAIVSVYKLRDRGLKRANFHELRVTKMPAALTEGGYMDSSIDIKVMRDDAKLKESGREMARRIAKLHNLKAKAKAAGNKAPTPVKDTTNETIYRVQVGSYSVLANAIAFAESVEAKTKLSTYVVDVDGKIRVQVGAFAIKANAEARLAELKKHYKDAYIETNGTNAIPMAEPQNQPVEPAKSIDQLAKEVLNGDHGNGEERKKSLGSRYNEVQKRVTELSKPKAGKTVDQMAQEIIDKKHGDGHENRRKSLGVSHALYAEVRERVNGMLKAGTTVKAKPAPKPVAKKKYNLPQGTYFVKSPMFRGNDVTNIQNALAAAGFYPNKGAKNNGIDGVFGNDTADAVKRFQTMNGLKADGIYGKATRDTLNKKVN